VKSSQNPFRKNDVEEWLGKLRGDAKEAEEVCLCLVGDKFTKACGDFIKANPAEIKTVSFEHLQSESTVKLIEYINGAGLGEKVMVSAIKPLEKDLFYKILTNSQSNKPVSREEFEASFKNAVSKEKDLAERIAEALSGKMQQEAPIRKCLTPVPPINKEIGLVGREDILKKIRNNLEKNNCIVLVNGLGGIGKTAVMQGICNELKDEGYYVAWISCGDSLREDLLTLRDGLGIPEADDSDTAYRKIIVMLQSDHRLAEDLYLFLDDLSRPLSEEEQGILNGLGIHVMATSRFAHDNFLNLPLDVLAEESALDMFYGYYLEKRTDKTPVFKDAAREIIRSVQSHTLLVELLAKAASKKGGTLETFRNELKKQGVFDVFKRNLSTNHDKNKSIEECVIELYKISELTPDQQHIMKLFTIFTPEKEIYYMIGEWAGLNLDALDQLVELGWLEQGGLENGYQIHQIVRDSIARQMNNEGETVRLEEYGEFLDRVIAADSYLGIEVPYQFIRERLVLAEDLAGFIEKSGREDAGVGNLFNNIGWVFDKQGDYEKALSYYKKTLEIDESVQGADNPAAAATYDNIAQVYDKQGDYEKALEYFKKALAIRERVLGSDHPDTATTYNNMALVYDHQGDYEKALKYYEKALAIKERVLGPDHPDTATTYSNMAYVFYHQGNYTKSLEYFKKAYAIRSSKLGENHPRTLDVKRSISFVESLQRN
jgi:tetratricopeptide (TPR) repeat protein